MRSIRRSWLRGIMDGNWKVLFRRSRMSDGDETPLFYLVILVDDEKNDTKQWDDNKEEEGMLINKGTIVIMMCN